MSSAENLESDKESANFSNGIVPSSALNASAVPMGLPPVLSHP